MFSNSVVKYRPLLYRIKCFVPCLYKAPKYARIKLILRFIADHQNLFRLTVAARQNLYRKLYLLGFFLVFFFLL